MGFGVTLGATVAASLVAVIAAVALLIGAAGTSAVTGTGAGTVMTAAQLENELVDNNTNELVTSAHCIPEGVRADGSGTYGCVIYFSDGDNRGATILVGPDGDWLEN
ncbi:hypothetical protein [Cryptosporangium phraense]|uniref:DUF4333 domain-containing protein n=1 Tax=Cryptosporangium phraense TaxID=2593070 RepID=A0A545AP06_9ACTN|nr:hypothetical protein [Cryptosporangium phraense]TQS43069.1 hypothetical protein FL583_21795 [Cryptosporangium phraense]